MISIFVHYLQRIGVAFGLSLALVGAVAAQQTTTSPTALVTPTSVPVAETEADDGTPLIDPNSGTYGLKIGWHKFRTALTFNKQAKVRRHLELDGDFSKQLLVAKKDSRFSDIAERKEAQDKILEELAQADPGLKDDVAKTLAESKIFAVTAEAAAQSEQAELAARKVVDSAQLAVARINDDKGLPPEMEEQLQKSGLTEEQIRAIRTAASTSFEQGYRTFQDIRDNQFQGLGKSLNVAFQQGEFNAFGNQVFAGGPPPQFLERLHAADSAAKADFFGKFGGDPKFAVRFGDIAKNYARDFSQGPPGQEGDFRRFLPPELANQIGEFRDGFRQKFADGNFDPQTFQSFHQEFEQKFGDQLRKQGGPQGGPDGPNQGRPYFGDGNQGKEGQGGPGAECVKKSSEQERQACFGSQGGPQGGPQGQGGPQHGGRPPYPTPAGGQNFSPQQGPQGQPFQDQHQNQKPPQGEPYGGQYSQPNQQPPSGGPSSAPSSPSYQSTGTPPPGGTSGGSSGTTSSAPSSGDFCQKFPADPSCKR